MLNSTFLIKISSNLTINFCILFKDRGRMGYNYLAVMLHLKLIALK